jgi:hypothetical protein
MGRKETIAMDRFEILCVTMHQKDFSKIKEMNIHSNVVFANQCDHTSYEELKFDGHVAKMFAPIGGGLSIEDLTDELCRGRDVTFSGTAYEKVE